jgi:hypothetical protein
MTPDLHTVQAVAADREPIDFIEGFLDHQERTAIRDMIRRHGWLGARARIATLLNDEADRGKQ